MTGAIAVSITAAVLLANAGSPAAQLAPDCSRTRSAVERAICADPLLAAADSQMEGLHRVAFGITGEPAPGAA
jgi:uncharacterized protein